jgi:hypothetical protein
MNLVLLNWRGGENDPFTAFNMELRSCLVESGCNVEVVDIEGGLAQKLFYLDNERKIHGAITFQGLASNIKVGETGKLLWETLGINLLCLHGDHPAQQPINHLVDSRYVTHIYPFPTFARYANSMCKRTYPAISFRLPFGLEMREAPQSFSGDYFVLPKNLDPIDETLDRWKTTLPHSVSKALIDVAFAIIENYKMGDPVEHHEVIDLFISVDDLARIASVLQSERLDEVRNFVHRELDKIYRNIASELIIAELADVPLHIFGRGWEKFKREKSSLHQFFDFSRVGNGDGQFVSNYGIIDVVPNKFSIHDRMMRSIAMQSSFLSNCGAYFNFDARDEYKHLFYTGVPRDLRSRVEAVMENPIGHRGACRKFGQYFRQQESFSDFLKFVYLRCLPD